MDSGGESDPTTPDATPPYTAARIAAALGRKRQALLRQLQGVAPSGYVSTRGKPAAAWSLAALPLDLQIELQARATKRGYRNASTMLATAYLLDKPEPRQTPPRAVSKALADDFAELAEYIDACSNPADPSGSERRGIWFLAFLHYERMAGQGVRPKRASWRVRKFLFARASFLAPAREALLKSYNRKFTAWVENGCAANALRDGREDNGNHFEFPEQDWELLVSRAVFKYRGDIAPAWRDLLAGREFSEATRTRYAGGAACKSHVPASIRDNVGPEVEIFTVMHQGPRAFDAIKGHVTRCYDGIRSLQCMSADDFTMPVYMYIPDGGGWFRPTRGQVLIFIDFRTLRVLGFSLQPDRNYNSLTIRSLCTHVFGEFGLPDVLYFERGIWKTSTLLKGKQGPFSWNEISQGLQEFGIRFIHAIRPRTKVIERIGGMLQDLMEGEPGYCGRMEMKDAPESLRKQVAQVDAGKKSKDPKAHPSRWFYSFDQWNRRLREIIAQYNATQQQGHVLNGLSPDDAFEKFMDTDNPPIQFPAGLRYLLAHDKRQVRVTLNGVTIQVGKQPFNYQGREIAHLVNREVLAWFDPENPDVLTVTDFDRKNPICVQRSENPNALECVVDPDSGTLGRTLERIEDQASYAKTRFSVLKTKFPLPERRALADAQTVKLGRQMDHGKAVVRERMNRGRTNAARASQLQREFGLPFSPDAMGDCTSKEIRELQEFIRLADATSGGQSEKEKQ